MVIWHAKLIQQKEANENFVRAIMDKIKTLPGSVKLVIPIIQQAFIL